MVQDQNSKRYKRTNQKSRFEQLSKSHKRNRNYERNFRVILATGLTGALYFRYEVLGTLIKDQPYRKWDLRQVLKCQS
jgi:hypothetical protein